jgi:hypothetical protein
LPPYAASAEAVRAVKAAEAHLHQRITTHLDASRVLHGYQPVAPPVACGDEISYAAALEKGLITHGGVQLLAEAPHLTQALHTCSQKAYMLLIKSKTARWGTAPCSSAASHSGPAHNGGRCIECCNGCFKLEVATSRVGWGTAAYKNSAFVTGASQGWSPCLAQPVYHAGCHVPT